MNQSHRSHNLRGAKFQATSHHRSLPSGISESPGQTIDHNDNHHKSPRPDRAIDHLVPLYIGDQRVECETWVDCRTREFLEGHNHSGLAYGAAGLPRHTRTGTLRETSSTRTERDLCRSADQAWLSAGTGYRVRSQVSRSGSSNLSAGYSSGFRTALNTIEPNLQKRFYIGCSACSSCRLSGQLDRNEGMM